MGRPPLTQEMAREVMVRLIRVTQSVILRDGMESITIRKVAKEAEVNSAILYKYFQDLDELLLFACVDLLKAYSSDLLDRERMLNETSARDIYLMTWEVFCKYAFQYPEYIRHLFFGRHSERLGHVIQAYYELFPEQLSGMSENLQIMLRSARLGQRNLEVLRPLLPGGEMDTRLSLINDLTVSYFQMLLQEKITGGALVDGQHQTERMLEACRFLIDAT